MNVVVVGAGRIGLPIATAIAARGHRVVACDIDPARVDAINRGENPISDEAGLAGLLAEVAGAGALRATTDTESAVRDAAVVLFAVAVDVDAAGRADTSALVSATRDVARGVPDGALCIFDTTLPVGSTRNLLAPELLDAVPGATRQIFVAFSPERLFMGRVLEDITKYPKVVGGLDKESGRRAADFYRAALGVEVIELASAEAAELSKLAEGAYRDLNIALANELAQVADVHRIDISEVIAAANSQSYSHVHTPGTGVGGHCIPVYPQFLMAGEGPSSLSALGRAVNDAMPAYAVRRLDELVGPLSGKTVLVAGLTFRPDVAVVAHTNAVDLREALEAAGTEVQGHDPLLDTAAIERLGFRRADEPLARFDVAIVHAFHTAYRDVDWASVASVVLDARNAMDRSRIESGGSRYLGIGRPLTDA
ncbi:MAG: nucleotide sugar dehydrogenase [Dehalococcoidia bacterium]